MLKTHNQETAKATSRISAQELTRATCEMLMAVGLSQEHADCVAGALVYAELRGQGSHGVSRLLDIYVRRLLLRATNPQPRITIAAEHEGVAVVDGDNGPGPVVGSYCMNLAISKAEVYGIGAVAARNSNHYGAAAYYLQTAVDAGMLAMTTTNAPPNMPPWGGREPFLGTNPLAFGAPAGRHDPILLDMATSVVAKGKIQLMEKEGYTSIPEGWALDDQGRPTTSLVGALSGMMVPIGGHKGYGLTVIVEILSALLSGADYGPHLGSMYMDLDRGQNVGHFFLALSLHALGSKQQVLDRMDALIDEIKATPRQERVEEILLPGEIEFRVQKICLSEGIPVESAVYQELCLLAQSLDVKPPEAMD